jgi:para-aminobenzoate synthetase component 1
LLDRVRDARVPTGARLARFRLYDWVVARDNPAGRTWLICNNFDPRPGRSLRDRLELFTHPTPPPVPATASPAPIHCDLDAAAYAVMVERCLDYITAGDVYQVNIARRLFGSLPCSPWRIYERLRETYPAPMAAFLQHSSGSTISISPETFLQGDSAGVETRPIKGTRPRGRNQAEDGRLAVELQSSAKDRAENVMIVDVLRNDLGRIATTGTVAVPELFGLRTLPTVHHLESRVTATPRPGISPADVLAACFPGGSVTGAPKIRAMEIIAELEPVPRGRYCGAIAAIGFDGYLTSSIPIRTIYTHRDRFQFHVGGGIVADSDPDLEYEETCHKADALLRILSSS